MKWKLIFASIIWKDASEPGSVYVLEIANFYERCEVDVCIINTFSMFAEKKGDLIN